MKSKRMEEQCCLLHAYSLSNRDEIMKSEKCGCFYCLRIFETNEISAYINDENGKTAVCPHCGVDSVLPDSRVSLSEELLTEMHKTWFS